MRIIHDSDQHQQQPSDHYPGILIEVLVRSVGFSMQRVHSAWSRVKTIAIGGGGSEDKLHSRRRRTTSKGY